MKALITGITGFAGSHLAELLLKEGHEVYGTARWRSKLDNIEHIKKDVHLLNADLRDALSMDTVLKESNPDWIFHLAAQSFVYSSWRAPVDTMDTNIIGTVNLLEAVRKFNPDIKIQFAGSSEEYGLVIENETPITEDNPLRPLSPYGASKVAGDRLCYQYVQSYGMKIVITRAFNHSVSKHTPIIIRDDNTGLIDIKYIGEIRDKYKVGGYLSGKLIDDIQVWDLRRYNLSVWSNNIWSKLNEISCHPVRDNKLMRLITKQGLIEITDNHSIISRDLKPLLAGKLNKGDKVATTEHPLSEIMYVDKEIAWFLGLFVAEGCVTKGTVSISNKDMKLLNKAKGILLKYYGNDSKVYDNGRGCYKLSVKKPYKFSNYLYNQVYASDKNKRVPKSILNAQKEAKLSFLEGYNAGDGLRKGYGIYEFKNFKTKSRILAAGLCYLISGTTKQVININYEDRNEGYISINLNSNIQGHEYWGDHFRKMDGVVCSNTQFDYTDEVWDFSTDNEMFQAGIGNLIAHNTGPRRGDVFVTSNFAKQIVEIEKGADAVICVGNLQALRDFTDVRDMVRAYYLAIQDCQYGVPYNICSEQAVSIEKVLEILLSKTSLCVAIKEDKDRMRPSDVPLLLGSCLKFKDATGWSREYVLEDTLEDLLDYWRDKCRR